MVRAARCGVDLIWLLPSRHSRRCPGNSEFLQDKFILSLVLLKKIPTFFYMQFHTPARLTTTACCPWSSFRARLLGAEVYRCSQRRRSANRCSCLFGVSWCWNREPAICRRWPLQPSVGWARHLPAGRSWFGRFARSCCILDSRAVTSCDKSGWRADWWSPLRASDRSESPIIWSCGFARRRRWSAASSRPLRCLWIKTPFNYKSRKWKYRDTSYDTHLILWMEE